MSEEKKMTADVRRYLCKRVKTITQVKLKELETEDTEDNRPIKDVPELAAIVKSATIPTPTQIKEAILKNLTVDDMRWGISEPLEKLFMDKLDNRLERAVERANAKAIKAQAVIL